MENATSSIQIEVTLDDDKIPQSIHWVAEGPGPEKGRDAKAMLLSFLDRDSGDTFKIDLWTRDMQVNEMDRFFYQTLRALSDTYHKATSNTQLAERMQQFTRYFGEQTELIKKEDQS